MKPIIFVVITIFYLISLQNLSADEVHLKNGDRISGKVINEDEKVVEIETDAVGLISIRKVFVARIITDEEIEVVKTKQKKDKLWERNVSLGYNKSSGNTQSNQLSMRLYANRKTERDEFTLKGDSFYSSSNKKMDAQRYSGMVRYAFSFWEKKWYNFYKFEGDHDRFANINYRLIPSIGLGYWFSDEPDWRFMTEIAVGLEHTAFRDSAEDSDEPVLIPRAFFEKELFGKSRIKQELSLYPSLSDASEYRLHSETIFINPINEKFSLQFSLIDDYNSNPAKDTKKNDTRFISSLVYSF
jgi:putative salt-induced outer membrane protein YdiY